MAVTVQLIPPFSNFASVNSFLVLSWVEQQRWWNEMGHNSATPEDGT